MVVRILIWLAVIAACAAVLFGIVHGYEVWRDTKVDEGDARGSARVEGKWAEDRVKRAAATVAAVQAARTEEQAAAALAAQGERDAQETSRRKLESDAAAGRRAVAAAGGLSGHIARLDAAARAIDLPSAAACPSQFVEQRTAAILARSILGSCVQEYRAMGQAADDSLRAVSLKLDTALSYIAAVAPK